MRKPSPKPPRKQQTSPELRNDLCDFLERKFYPGRPVIFQKDRSRLLAWVVLWPAAWFDKRGVTVAPDRYRAIFMDGLAFGRQTKINYLPAYLRQIIQSHFSHHGQEYYEAAKLLRENALLKDILSGTLASAARTPDPVRELAQAARLLKSPRKRVTVSKGNQLDLI